MTETGSSQRTTWLREVVIAFAIAGVVSAYYSAKLARAEQRAEQAEAQVKQMQQEQARTTPATDKYITLDQLKKERAGVPSNLACPDGTKLQRVVSYDEFMKDSNAKETDWECIGKPKPVSREPF